MRAQILIISFLILLLISGCNLFKVSEPATNNNPRIEAVTYNKDVMFLTENEMICQAMDTDGDSLQYEWSAADGSIIGTGPKILWVPPYTMGDYEVAVRVYDGKGGEVYQVIPIRVLTNADGTTAPPITLKMSLASSSLVSENRTTKVGTATKIICIVDNAAGKKLIYEWADGGGRLKGKGIEDKTGAVVFWTAPPLTQVYTVTVTVRDEQGNVGQGQVDFDVFCCPRN